ncbi:tetratricopeptide repeat protein [Lentisphaerota bacterium ZTH]|nr:tetratricopeptide repeat protein [Lentisphaerota bacterium]WET07407.1 tetratricopeptide repeat protein [Lentisphaerota bacterium ZTH]
MKLFQTVILITAASCCSAASNLEERVTKLERELALIKEQIKPLLTDKHQIDNTLQQLRARARQRMRADLNSHSFSDLTYIEKTYKQAYRKWGTEECIEKLKKLIKKYPESNRAGCAILYLGQMSKDPEKKKAFLQQAIKKFGGCYYGDGVQVAPYAAFQLGFLYYKKGEKGAAKALFDQIKAKYPDSIDHKGRKLVRMLPAER